MYWNCPLTEYLVFREKKARFHLQYFGIFVLNDRAII